MQILQPLQLNSCGSQRLFADEMDQGRTSKPSLGSYHGILFISTMPEALSVIVINK